MNYKTVEINENRSEKIHYPENGFPVIRMQNALDDFLNGEIGYHWHSEFQFGLLLKGELDYCVFRNPISKLHRSLQAGDGFFINSKVLHGYRQTKPGSEIFLFGIPVSFFSSLSSQCIPENCSAHPALLRFRRLLPQRGKNFPILRLFVNFTHWTPWITTTSFTVWNCSAASGGSDSDRLWAWPAGLCDGGSAYSGAGWHRPADVVCGAGGAGYDRADGLDAVDYPAQRSR